MKVTVKKFLSVRAGKPSVNAPCYLKLAPGSEVEVDGELYKGDNFEGIDTWMKDQAGNYYWSGAVIKDDALQPDKESSPILPSGKNGPFNLFDQLEVETVWNRFEEYGENVTVAILDSGYDTSNSDLFPGVSGGKAFHVSPPVQITDVRSPMIHDTFGHGTFCASIIGARNLGKYKIGIAPKSRLLIGKLRTSGGLDAYTGLDLILSGIDWAINSGAEIISVSYGKFAFELPGAGNYLVEMQKKFASVIKNKKVLVFSLAGNNPPDVVLTRENYPASFDGYVSVGASENDRLSKVTSLSDKTVIHARGVDVESYSLAGTIEKGTGTSYSTPIVAGIGALAVSYLKRKRGDWSPEMLLKKMYDTGIPLDGNNNKKNISLVNLFNNL